MSKQASVRAAYFARLEPLIEAEERAEAACAERTGASVLGELSFEERLALTAIAAGMRVDMVFMDAERSLYARGLIQPTQAILTPEGAAFLAG
jgi:hypothetical protein